MLCFSLCRVRSISLAQSGREYLAMLLMCTTPLAWVVPPAWGHGPHAHDAASPTATLSATKSTSPASPYRTAHASFDPAGRLHVLLAGEKQLWLRLSDDAGRSFQPDRLVLTGEPFYASGDSRPKISTPAAGVVLVSYTQQLAQPWTGHIRLLRSQDGGASFAPPRTVNDDTQIISHRFDTLLAHGAQLWVAWLDKRDRVLAEQGQQPYDGAALYVAHTADASDPGGALPNRKLADQSCECCRVAMAADSDGTPVLFWRHVFPGSVRDHAMLRLDAASQMIRVTQDQWVLPGCPHHGPALAIGPDGVYHFAWFTMVNQVPRLQYRHSRDRGQHFSRPVPFGDTTQQAAHPALLSLGQTVWLAWQQFDGQRHLIRAMHSRDGGRHWTAPRTVAHTRGQADQAQLLSHQGQVFLSWLTADEGYRLLPLGRAFPSIGAPR